MNAQEAYQKSNERICKIVESEKRQRAKQQEEKELRYKKKVEYIMQCIYTQIEAAVDKGLYATYAGPFKCEWDVAKFVEDILTVEGYRVSFENASYEGDYDDYYDNLYETTFEERIEFYIRWKEGE